MPILLKQLLYLRRNSGAILFIALWILVLLSILAIGISSRVTSEIRLSKYLDNRLISLYLAKAALNWATIELEKDKTPTYDTLFELRTPRQNGLGNGSYEFELLDEESLLNINTASQEILGRLPGLTADLAKAISESSLKPFLLKEELLLIEGITPEIFSEFKDLITIYGEGKVNINTASSQVLNVLGFDDSLIEIILNYRRGEDGIEATEDDREFKDAALILSTLREFTPLTVDQELQIIELTTKNLLSVNASNLKINIETKVLGNPINNYTVILKRSDGKIKFWQER